MNKIMTVQFQGSEIFGFQLGGIVFIAVKPIVEGMGLNWEPQRQRIQRDPILSKGTSMIKVPFGRGGPQEMVCLPLDLIHGWLFTIDSNRIKAPEIREKVILFQEECYSVLCRHFSGERDRLGREANEAASLSLRLVSECRQIWGNRSAAELWEKRGLPKVPAMDAVFRQTDLFEQATLVPAARSVAA
jgi:hypothetical protein